MILVTIVKMESRFLLQEESRCQMKAARPTATSCSAAFKNSRFCGKVAEFACSACLFCVCCPLSFACCCIKLPCKIGWRATQRAVQWAACASKKRIFAAYSSFSDIDSDSMPCKSHACTKESDPSIQRIGWQIGLNSCNVKAKFVFDYQFNVTKFLPL